MLCSEPMRLSRFLFKSTKEVPKEAHCPSHIFLIRGGYIRPVSTGIFSLLPLARRITSKIENIIREEMNQIDGQEILLPVILPKELWDESGRYESVGPELLRFKDRNDKQMLLGMTHEEAVVQATRSQVSSYKQLPFMVYQIQTKYRDEARPRAGLIRVREFTMKDAYSFHTSQDDLEAYYERAHKAYKNIFSRIGVKDYISIESDSGMMGGAKAHEFMAMTPTGEDTIFLSSQYRANRDIAKTALKFEKSPQEDLTEVYTPGAKTIEAVAEALKVKSSQTGKAVFYSDKDDRIYFIVIRGDIEVNEPKLKNYLNLTELKLATDNQIKSIGAEPGFASPMGVDTNKVRVIFDHSAAETSNLVVGANKANYHYTGFNFERDLAKIRDQIDIIDIATAREGDPCPVTGEPLQMKKGIEIGNIFQLGTKYTESMNCTFLDKNGKSNAMIMGCYGIGIGRSMASIIEQSHDKYGPIWPKEIAPFQVHLIALNLKKDEISQAAEKLYQRLLDQGIDVLFDDRDENAGSAFNDADLIGVPFRLIISKKTVTENSCEFKTRDGNRKELWKLDAVIDNLKPLL